MNKSDVSPQQLYRSATAQLLLRYQSPPGADPDEHLKQTLEKYYAGGLASLTSEQQAQAKEKLLIGSYPELFVPAAGLFTYGDFDKAYDLVNCLPSTGAMRNLSLAIAALTPMSSQLDPRHEPDKVRLWLTNNASRLSWNESSGIYVQQT